MNNLYVLLPSYNEEENIETLIESWLKEKDKLKDEGFQLNIVGIDDGSKDNTKAIIQKMDDAHEEVTLVAHEKNSGLGAGVNTGLRYFYENGKSGDIALIMDADNTHEPRYVHSMLKKMKDEGKDVVIASRYCEDSSIVGVPKHRNFLSSGAKGFYTLMMGVPNVKDYTCGYRTYAYDTVKKGVETYGADFIKENSFACMIEVLYKLHKTGAQFGEVPFELRYDQKLGESKMRILKTTRNSVVTTFKLRFTK